MTRRDAPGPRGCRTRPAAPATRRDRGLSLIEVLVAIVLLGTVAAAVLSAVSTSITASATSRDHAAGLVWLQSANDYLSHTSFLECAVGHEAAVADGYRAQLQSAGAPVSALSWPQGHLTVVRPVLFWADGAFAPTCNPASGIQQITLQVTSGNGRQTDTLVIVKARPSS